MIDDLKNVNIKNVKNGQILQYSDNKWINIIVVNTILNNNLTTLLSSLQPFISEIEVSKINKTNLKFRSIIQNGEVIQDLIVAGSNTINILNDTELKFNIGGIYKFDLLLYFVYYELNVQNLQPFLYMS